MHVDSIYSNICSVDHNTPVNPLSCISVKSDIIKTELEKSQAINKNTTVRYNYSMKRIMWISLKRLSDWWKDSITQWNPRAVNGWPRPARGMWKMEPTPLFSLLFNFHDKLIPIYGLFSSVKQKVVKVGKKLATGAKNVTVTLVMKARITCNT